MDFSKIKKISFILLILFILLFPFWCVRGLCAEDVEINLISNVNCGNPSLGKFGSGGSMTTFYCEKGYVYHITLNAGSFERPTVYSTETPEVNGEYTFLFSTSTNEFTFDYYCIENCYLCINGDLLGTTQRIFVTRDLAEGMTSSVTGLVENVGISQLWNIFDISINYIVVVVLFAFGCYIIFRIIRKISRGKEGL